LQRVGAYGLVVSARPTSRPQRRMVRHPGLNRNRSFIRAGLRQPYIGKFDLTPGCTTRLRQRVLGNATAANATLPEGAGSRVKRHVPSGTTHISEVVLPGPLRNVGCRSSRWRYPQRRGPTPTCFRWATYYPHAQAVPLGVAPGVRHGTFRKTSESVRISAITAFMGSTLPSKGKERKQCDESSENSCLLFAIAILGPAQQGRQKWRDHFGVSDAEGRLQCLAAAPATGCICAIAWFFMECMATAT